MPTFKQLQSQVFSSATLTASAMAWALLGGLYTGCNAEPVDPLPSNLDRAELIRRAESSFSNLIKIPSTEHFETVLADGTVAGPVLETLRRVPATPHGLPEHLELVLEADVRSARGRETLRFETAYPHALINGQMDHITSNGPLPVSRLTVSSDQLQFTLEEDEAAGEEELTKVIPNPSYTLVDHFAVPLWLSLRPQPGDTLTHIEVAASAYSIRSLRTELPATDETFNQHPLAQHIATIVRTSELTTYAQPEAAAAGYDQNHRLIVTRFDRGMELRLNLSLTSTEERAAGSQFRRAEYLLPHEIDQLPARYAEVKAATVRVCTTNGCGTGTFVSNSGHLLTAAHVITQDPKGIFIPELAGSATVTSVIPIDDGQVDAAILKVTPTQGGDLGRNHSFHCAKISNVSIAGGVPVWTLGFPKATASGGARHSDGLHEFTAFGNTLVDYPELPAIPGQNEDPYLGLERMGHVFRSDAVTTHGFSGGPVLTLSGEIVGITIAGDLRLETAAILRGDNDEGAQLLALSTASVLNLIERDYGAEHARDIFSCNPSPLEPTFQATARVSRDADLPDVMEPEAASLLETLDRQRSQRIQTLIRRLKRNRSFAKMQRGLDLLGRTLIEELHGRPGLAEALRERIARGMFVLPEDTYPGVTHTRTVLTAALDTERVHILLALGHLIQDGVIYFDTDQRHAVIEILDEVYATTARLAFSAQ